MALKTDCQFLGSKVFCVKVLKFSYTINALFAKIFPKMLILSNVATILRPYELLGVHFKLYFDAHIATDVTAMLYCECHVKCIVLL